MNYSPVFGTCDLLPDSHKYLTFIKKVFRHEFRKNGFRRISIPIIERTDLINSTSLWANFVIENSDFALLEDLSLWILRAYLDNDVKEEIQPVYYYYMDQFYRKEDWVLKWIESIWAEIIWENDPILDAIQIYLTYTVLNKIWLWDKFEIIINSVWVEKERDKYREELFSFYENKKHLLTEESKKLLNIDPMLILKSKNEDEIILNSSAPKFREKFLKKDSKAHYEKFREYLDILKVPYKEENSLIPLKPYATNSIWQFISLDSKIISEWFRHNTLAKNIYPKELPITWFYVDVKVLIDMLVLYRIKIRNKDKIDLFFIQLWDEAKKVVLPLSLSAREAWINTVVSLWTPSMKEQILKAQRAKARYIVIVWLIEARNWIFQVRNNEDGTQEEVKKDDLINYIINKIWKENLDFYSPESDFIIE